MAQKFNSPDLYCGSGICDVCGTEFIKKSRSQKRCSAKCSMKVQKQKSLEQNRVRLKHKQDKYFYSRY